MHPPMGGEFSTDFKSLNRIEISSLVQVLFNFDRFQGSPGWWLMGMVVPLGVPCTHACMLNIVNMINMDASMSVAICNFYTCICMRVHVCGDTPMSPDAPRHPPSTCPLHRAAGSPKHRNSISLELIEIFQFYLNILYL